MPWLETEPMNEKVKFIAAYLNKEETTFVELCERFHISTKTGYKHLNRFKAEGIEGLKARSSRPLHYANRMPEGIEANILKVKYHHPTWGAKKVLNWLKQEQSPVPWPAKSTIDDLFKRHHLVKRRQRKKQVAPYTEPFLLCQNPNDVWSIDYKGQFRLGNQEYCYPLTVTDNFSRYLLAVEGSKKISFEQTQRVLTLLFSEFGLPLAIRSDNGVPFAGTGLGGLSRLAIWLIKLGIVPERIRKGHPEENGRHERMHLTLKQETASPPRSNQKQQQACFNQFKKTFNEDRPHEGIHFNRPARLYVSSYRKLPKTFAPIEYDSNFLYTRNIRTNGTIKWLGKELFLSELLIGEPIALKPRTEEEWIIYFSFFPIGIFNERLQKIIKI
jgi:transposase InsO family protein